jgi:hypothetical protein
MGLIMLTVECEWFLAIILFAFRHAAKNFDACSSVRNLF